MRMKFSKGEDGEVAVTLVDNTEEKEFDYVEMVKYLHSNNPLDEPEFSDGISENEKVKLQEMIKKMNEMVVTDTEGEL